MVQQAPLRCSRGWIGTLVVLAALLASMGTGFKDVTGLPSSESSHAYSLLGTSSNSSTQTGRIAWRTDGAAVDSAAVRAETTTMLDEVAKLPGVLKVTSPYTRAGDGQLSASHHTAYANVTINTDKADVTDVDHAVQKVVGSHLDVTLGGQAFAPQTKGGGPAEIIGILAALAVLLLVFRSVWAAALPIITGVAGVITSLLLVMLASHVVDLSSNVITMGSLIGLGVGIDYSLFIVNRHRKALMSGSSVAEAAGQAADTSGRAVIFAGLTVIAALLAMVVVGMSVLTGMGQAAAITVAFTVLAALTLLPALLGLFGLRVLSKRQRAQLAAGDLDNADGEGGSGRSTPAAAWGRLVTRGPKRMIVLAGVVLAIVAIPTLSLRIGNADASTDPGQSQSRQYYEMMSPAFGKGVDAGLVLVASTPDQGATRALDSLADQVAKTAGVATVTPPQVARQGVSVVQVTPTTSAGSQQTEDLVNHLRDDVIPAAEAGSALHVYVGGETASNIDIAQALMSKLPLYLALVAILGFLLLVIAFRSLLVPLVGAISNLATIVVGLGFITAIFQWGWGTSLLGVGDGGPVSYIVPVMIVGVMFGLSMDYQVFLVSRMHEEWTHAADNDRSIRVGLKETAKVIATAATIMLCVFASFGFSGERIVASIGVGLALAVVVDAFVVRMVLVPALMKVLGARNWAYPRWADKITPHVSVEGPGTATLGDQQVSAEAPRRLAIAENERP
ncbi:MMPL family transporter [Flexivirga alba]|uniref:MMPL family transporter n=1 Tax=Flexivirga alba TaxID=702742 RepID=A0ABW2ACE2_9MICO